MNAYIAALTMLSRRELSTRQVRDRLERREFAAGEIDEALERLTTDGTLNDRRVAGAVARTATSIKSHGRQRVLRQLQQLGIDHGIAKDTVKEVFGDLDEHALLDRAIERRLRGRDVRMLDVASKARLVRHLLNRGFDSPRIWARLRGSSRSARDDDK